MQGRPQNLVPLTPERAREIGKLGGRPRKPRATEVEVQTLKERLAPRIEATVERLVQLSGSADEAVALRACNAILDRYYGKPSEASAPADSRDGRGFTMADLIPLAEAEQLLDGEFANHSKHT
jgi:hypothetical protein